MPLNTIFKCNYNWLGGFPGCRFPLFLSHTSLSVVRDEPQCNKLIYNKDPGLRNNILQPSYIKMYGEELRYNGPLL